MIPKIIHYCWFGRGEKPELAIKCIYSWKKFLPDYEIKEWNEDNFDINIIPYVKEAYDNKKYAFVSDYARFWILFHYGGLYFDTDVEIIRPMYHIIERGPFMGCEEEANGATGGAPPVAPGLGLGCNPGLGLGCNPGLGLGCNPGLGLYQEMLDFYQTIHFVNKDGSLNQKTVVKYTTQILVNHGLKDTNQVQFCAGVWVYPKEYFCPLSYLDMKMHKTKNTVTIHHYAGSWRTWEQKLDHKFRKLKDKFPQFYYYCIFLPIFELHKYKILKQK